jgi:glutaredoxin
MIIVYTKPNCEKCTSFKEEIKKRGLEYKERSILDSDALSDLVLAGVDITEAPIAERDGKFYTNKTGLLKSLIV